MEFCDPSHEKAYWTCPNLHDPVGIVQLPREVDYAFAVALTSVCDHFDSVGVGPFAEIDSADEVAGLVTGQMLERYQRCIEFKRMRQRKGHDQPAGNSGQDDESEQTTLKAMTDGGHDRPGDVVYHVVCHGCPYEDVVEDDRVLAAASEITHQKRTGHYVEYDEIGGEPGGS